MLFDGYLGTVWRFLVSLGHLGCPPSSKASQSGGPEQASLLGGSNQDGEVDGDGNHERGVLQLLHTALRQVLHNCRQAPVRGGQVTKATAVSRIIVDSEN